MTRELHLLLRWQLQDFLEFTANIHENFFALFDRSSLATSNIAITTTWDALSNCASPDTDTVEALSDITDNTHDLAITFLLEGLTNGREHDMEPELINVNQSLVLELVRPLSTVLVLLILPLWTNTFLEEVVVRLEG